MFCTLEDAWGEKNFIELQNNIDINTSNKSYEIQKPVQKENINDNITRNEDLYKQYLFLKQKFNNIPEESQVCIATENHISKCKFCQNKYYSSSQPFNLHKMTDFIKINKDLITIILIGLLIILFINLIFKF